MNDFALTVEELAGGEEPRVDFILTRGNEAILRRNARVFSEDDIIAAGDELVRAGGLNATDVDQYLAELIEPIRIKWLRSRDRKPGEEELQGPQAAMPRYVAEAPIDGREPCIRDMANNSVLANFVLILDEDVEVQDDVESRHEFAGRLTVGGRTVAFRIGAKDFADNGKLRAALFDAGGCEVVIHCGMDELRRAISILSKEAGGMRRRRLTTNFGWTADKKAYLTPRTRISGSGIEVLDEKAELRVELGSETPACCLDMKKLERDELLRVKKHVVEDLLAFG